jgi:hypothetical protein
MHSLKRFTARRCNEILGRRGSFWQDESYDHCVRGEDELSRIIEYVELNPVKAGLVTERQMRRFSSAAQRISSKIEAGMPLPKLTEE